MFVDAHAHIDHYADDPSTRLRQSRHSLGEALRQIDEHRILTVCVAMDIPSYLRTKEIAASSPWLVPTFGIHPWEAPHYCDNLELLDPYLEQTPIIGEAGLDFHWVDDRNLYAGQMAVFRHQCQWAQRLSKRMNLHTKGAEREVLQTLTEFGLRGSIIHWYSGPVKLIDAYLELGCYFTVGVELLTSPVIEAIAQKLPLDRILLETDNPGGYEWLTGQVGMPAVLLDVLDKVAGVKEIAPADFKDHLTRNWQEFSKGIEGLEIPMT